MNYEVLQNSVSDSVKQKVLALAVEVFENVDEKKLSWVLQHQPGLCLVYSELNGEMTGFKLGYAIDESLFYSWLGGVKPAFRRHGLATTMMTLQHDWCKENGFKRVETRSTNQKKEMLLLNLKSGFDVVGTLVSDKGLTKIVSEKTL